MVAAWKLMTSLMPTDPGRARPVLDGHGWEVEGVEHVAAFEDGEVAVSPSKAQMLACWVPEVRTVGPRSPDGTKSTVESAASAHIDDAAEKFRCHTISAVLGTRVLETSGVTAVSGAAVVDKLYGCPHQEPLRWMAVIVKSTAMVVLQPAV